ncbi:MAG TPA: FtsQ-type POTRA domain-containing protein [Stenomitos sp.]
MSERPAAWSFTHGPWGFIQAFVLGGALVALWLMPQWTWDGELRVAGIRRLSHDEIAKAAKGSEGKPLFLIDPATIKERIQHLDGVEDVKVRRWLLPARVEVTVKERSPILRVAGGSAYLDATGVAFRLPNGEDTKAIPIEALVSTRSLDVTEQAALKVLVASWPEGAKGTVDLRNATAWSAVIDGVQVLLGAPQDMAEKLRLYSHLLPLARKSGKAIRYMDLRFPEAPTVRTSEATP